MKVSEYIYQVRGLLNDLVKPFGWSDVELAIATDEAYREMARRTRCIKDRPTTTGSRVMCTIPIVKDQAEYTHHAKILDIYSVKHSALTSPLTKVSEAELDIYYSNWWNITSKYPTYYIIGRTPREIRLVAIPNEAGTGNLLLSISRMPLISLLPYTDANNLEPVDLRDEWHHFLIPYILYKAYSKDDIETRNDKKAAENLNLWEDKVDQVKRDMIRYYREDRAFAPPGGVL